MRATISNTAIGDGVSIHYYTDIVPHTIVAKTARTITIMPDIVKRITDPEFIPGGFSAICVNNREIKYEITPRDPKEYTGTLIRLTANKAGEFKDLTLGRSYYYDYNF